MNEIEILKAYFQQKTTSFAGDVKEEIKKMNQQSLVGYLYYVYGKTFESVYLGLTLVQSRFEALEQQITTLLNVHHIDHLFFKGSVLSKLYPDPVLRTRGDIDFIVKKEDYIKAQTILEQNDFIKLDKKNLHHTTYIKNQLMVELHQALFEEDELLDSYFNDVFSHTHLIQNHHYEWDNNYHYLYCVCHLNRHLIDGEGLRYLLDFYYMNLKWELNIDWIAQELKRMNLYTLHCNIMHAVYIITNHKLIFEMGTQGQALLDYMLKQGIHNKNKNQEDNFKKAYVLSEKSKFKYCMMVLFTPNHKAFPRLSKYKVLYPILLICQFFRLLTKLPKLIWLIKINQKERRTLQNQIKNIGIIDKINYDNN